MGGGVRGVTEFRDMGLAHQPGLPLGSGPFKRKSVLVLLVRTLLLFSPRAAQVCIPLCWGARRAFSWGVRETQVIGSTRRHSGFFFTPNGFLIEIGNSSPARWPGVEEEPLPRSQTAVSS